MKVTVKGLKKSYPQETALNGLTFTLDDEEILCVLGASGSGKSTLLRCLCGLEKWDEGTILFDGKQVDSISANQWGISMVFDEPKLIGHLTVFDNIALGLKYKGYSDIEINKKVTDIAEEMEMSDYLYRKPATLSAGQKQRVSLARALVRECQLLLLDEALSNLNEELKIKMVDLLIRLNQRYHFSCLYVTHDRKEAQRLNSRYIMLEKGQCIELP